MKQKQDFMVNISVLNIITPSSKSVGEKEFVSKAHKMEKNS